MTKKREVLWVKPETKRMLKARAAMEGKAMLTLLDEIIKEDKKMSKEDKLRRYEEMQFFR